MGRIIEAMHRLRDAGNTLVVVEHDPAVMLAADRLIDMGPGPGERGGRIVFDGTPEAIKSADTLTGAYLGARKHVGMGLKRLVTDATPRLDRRRRARPQPEERHGRVPAAAPRLRHRRLGLGQEHADAGRAVPGAAAPLRQGDRDAGRARRAARRRAARRGGVRRPEPDRQDGALEPGELRRRVRRDPQDLRRRRRSRRSAATAPACSASTPATAAARPAAARASSTSRCSSSPTSTCAAPIATAQRFRAEILDVKIDRRLPGEVIRELSVADVLDLTVSRSGRALPRRPRGRSRVLQPIVDVGLEYVKLGQPVPTLSGGEAQRLKLAGFLAEAAQSRASRSVAKKGTLFLFDEPTTGPALRRHRQADARRSASCSRRATRSSSSSTTST